MDFSSRQEELFKQHLMLVLRANEKVNLTRIDTLEKGMELHVEDSLSALEEAMQAPEGKYVDIGTGGGFPGVTLAIATGRPTVLVESRKNKAEALEEMIREMGIGSSVRVYCGRAEQLAREERESFSLATARAVSKTAALLELASPLLCTGGLLVCYKARLEAEEVCEARRVEPLTGMRLKSKRSFTLSEEAGIRTILCYEKGEDIERLPRRDGLAQKKPLQ